jgi:uncharacterized protein (TIGR02996 family)
VRTRLALRDLLDAIDEDFDNLAHWHPLADWLMERGDPRGELIAIDLALEAGEGERDRLRDRRAEILARSAPALLGETFAKVVAEGYGTVTWRRGFVDELEFRGDPRLPHRRACGWLVTLVTTVHEPFSLLRGLDLAYTDLVELAPLARFRHLERLTLTGTAVTTAAWQALATALPRLRITP